MCGYVELRAGATLEDLRARGQLLKTGQFVTCEAFDSHGEICGESTFVALSALVFID
jgi:hypothetical protein